MTGTRVCATMEADVVTGAPGPGGPRLRSTGPRYVAGTDGMAHFAPSLDSFLPSRERRTLIQLVKGAFDLRLHFLAMTERELLRGAGVLACPVRGLLGCTSRCCVSPPPRLDGEATTVTCELGLSWRLMPLDAAGVRVATAQVGPFFLTAGAKAAFVRARPSTDVVANDMPVMAPPRDASLVVVNDWIRDKVASRVQAQELSKKEMLLLFLVDSTKIINSLDKVDDLLNYLTDISTYITNASTGFILRLDDAASELFIHTARGVQPHFDRDYRIPVGRGITGWVAEHGIPVNSGDTSSDSRYLAVNYTAAAELAVPIKLDGKVIGVLVVDSFEKDAFSDFDQQVLVSLASQVSTVMEASSHESESRSRIEQIEALYRVSQACGATLNLDELLESVLTTVSEVFSASGAAILIRRETSNELLVWVPESGQVKRVSDFDLHSDKGVLGWVVANEEPLLINSGDKSLFEDFKSFIVDGTTSLLCVPLACRGSVLGAMLVSSADEERRYRRLDLNLLTTVAGQVAHAVRNAQLFERSERQVAELSLITEVGKALNSSLDLDNLLEYIVDMISSIIEADRSSLMLLDPKSNELAVSVYKGMEKRETQNLRFALGEGVAGVVAETRKAVLIKDTRKDPRFLDVNRTGAALTLISAPVVNKDEIIGVLNFERSLSEKRSFVQDDLNLLNTLASHAGIAIENARLYQNLIAVYFDTIRSLANALEAKDAYTHGHSRRVAKDAVRIAKKLGLERKRVETIRHAALLHDIGKIGIRDAILFKPGKLSAVEMAHIRRHPVVGANMIQSIEFLKDVTDIIRYHHERVDGKGFPYGLRNDEIPLGARIVCIADAFDAMTTTRPYREGMRIPEAIDELIANKNSQFDPELVDVFVDIIYGLHPSLASRRARTTVAEA